MNSSSSSFRAWGNFISKLPSVSVMETFCNWHKFLLRKTSINSMSGLLSSGGGRNYDDFKKQIPKSVLPIFDEIRNFCLGLGEKVVEDVRMHRIVFGKSLSFRWFADVEPEAESILVKIQKNRKETPQIMQIKSAEELAGLKDKIKIAFETIR